MTHSKLAQLGHGRGQEQTWHIRPHLQCIKQCAHESHDHQAVAYSSVKQAAEEAGRLAANTHQWPQQVSDVAEKEEELHQRLWKLHHCPWQLPQRLWKLQQCPWKGTQRLGKPVAQVELPRPSRGDDEHCNPLRRQDTLLVTMLIFQTFDLSVDQWIMCNLVTQAHASRTTATLLPFNGDVMSSHSSLGKTQCINQSCAYCTRGGGSPMLA